MCWLSNWPSSDFSKTERFLRPKPTAGPLKRKNEHVKIEYLKKEVVSQMFVSENGQSWATRRLFPFSGVARACNHAHMIFTAVSKRDASCLYFKVAIYYYPY